MTQNRASSTRSQDVRTFTDRTTHFTTILDAAGDAWEVPTPCDGWNVRDVVAHVIDSQRNFFASQDLDAGPAPELADPAAAWRSHLQRVTSVLARPGVAEREYDGFFGPTTIGATMADFYGWDLIVHGWDVARATGQEWSISEGAATAMHATADGWGQSLYAEGICAAPVEVVPDASATDRLLARLGRDPSWRPA